MTDAQKLDRLATELEEKHNPNGDPRCEDCHFLIRPFETVYAGGRCAFCAGAASFVGRLA